MSFHKAKSANAHPVRRTHLKRLPGHKGGIDLVKFFEGVAVIRDEAAFRERMDAVEPYLGRGKRLGRTLPPHLQDILRDLILGRKVASPLVLPEDDASRGREPPAVTEAAPELADISHVALAALPGISAFIAPKAWVPSKRQLASGRQLQEAILAQPDQDTVKAFAERVGKSTAAVYAAIKGRKLLSLRLSERDQRVPSWQLDLNVRRLVGQVLCAHPHLDTWTAYQALTTPVGVLGGLSLVEASQQGSYTTDRLLAIFQAQLGLQPDPAAAAKRQGA